jgi:hypothetical protein
MIVGCSDAERTSELPHMLSHDAVAPAAFGPPRPSANIFYSGHSLMDRPLPDFVQAIARSLDTPAQWNRQYIVGSSIQRRTQGAHPSLPGWHGYRDGYNRDGEGLDVIAELRAPQTIDGSYDVLVITEEHTMLDTLINGDTIRQLRHYHERFIEGNPAGTTYFYEPWFGHDDKSDPRRWIDYERAASRVWQCMATRVNVSLEAEGRSDRIISLPAGAALAALVERATQEPGMPSLTRTSVLETVDSLMPDGVHLTALGSYYMSLVTYAAIYRRSPQGAWWPEGVDQAQASMLQAFAWQFVSDYYQHYRPLSLEQCRAQLSRSAGIAPLWSYIRDAYWRKDVGAVHSYVRYLRRLVGSRRLFNLHSAANPFYFDPATDKTYWHAAPTDSARTID